MEGLPPLDLEVYDKDFVYQGKVARPQAVSLTARHNAAGGGAFTLDSDDDAVEALAAPGARLLARYRYDPDDPDQLMHFLSGPVTQVDLGGALAAPTRAFTVTDDWDILNQFFCRPVPASGWGSQGGEDVYYSTSGPAETAIKAIVSANLGINPWDLTVATTHGWGETITLQARMNLLTDRIFPALNYAHVGISVRQVGAGLVLDAYDPTVHAVPLTVASGVVAKGDGSLLRPTVSRVAVRGGSEPSQVFETYTNTAVESAWGFCGWAPVLDVSESTTSSYLEAKAWEVLNAGARQASVSIELAETDDWRFGDSDEFFRLGDEVSIELADAPLIEDAINEVEITWTEGLVVTPRIGERAASPDQVLAKALQKVAARQRITNARG
jgi:hypothetical protein